MASPSPSGKRKWQCFRFLLPVLASLGLLGGPVNAHAQSSYLAVLALLGEGRYDEARAYAARIAGNERVRRDNLAFLEAVIHKRERRFAEAARQFTALLDADPSQSRVRQELAHTLFLMGDDDRARHHLEILKSTVEGAELHAAYDRMLLTIRNRRPWTLDGFLGLAPSSNINDGTPGRTVHIAGIPFTNENSAKSGVGLSYGLAGSYRFELRPQWALTVGSHLFGRSYTESRFDWLALRSYSELSRETGSWRTGAGVAGERTFSGWQTYGSGVGPYAATRWNLSTKGQLYTRLSWMQRRYDKVPVYNGSETDLALTYRHIFSPRLVTWAGIETGATRTTRDFTSYHSARPSVSMDYLVNAHFILHGRVFYEHRTYRGDFPLTGMARRDDRYTAGVGTTLRSLGFRGYVPRISYDYHRATSNIELFKRTRHSVNLIVTKRY